MLRQPEEHAGHSLHDCDSPLSATAGSQAARDPERDVESIAVAGAFLQGFTFQEIQRMVGKALQAFSQRFGKVTRQQLPFTHCGCDYARVKNGYKISQKEFAEKLKPAPVSNKKGDEKLTKDEVSDLRSILALWFR
eukprot:s4382_g8.t1